LRCDHFFGLYRRAAATVAPAAAITSSVHTVSPPADDQRNAAERHGGQRLPTRAAQVPAHGWMSGRVAGFDVVHVY
jgi:hypothetical protein